MADITEPDFLAVPLNATAVTSIPGAAPGKTLSEVARRALLEAEARRQAERDAPETPMPKERDGPRGQEPTRFGDWERGGIAYDF
jgi:hypothetical protein